MENNAAGNVAKCQVVDLNEGNVFLKAAVAGVDKRKVCRRWQQVKKLDTDG